MEEVRGSSPLGPTMSMKKITKAIIPAAGLGTRFLPQTKAMPKEMLPIIDKPIIQYVVEEAVSAGITDVIIVTGMHKRSLEDHFDYNAELENKLRETGKAELAEEIHRIGDMANFIYVRQKGFYGNGTPILNASHLIGEDEPFLVLWADDFVVGKKTRAQQLVQAYEKLQAPVISLIEVPDEDTSKYGMVEVVETNDHKTFKLKNIIEKPTPGKSPSNYAAVGGYILTPQIIRLLDGLKPDDKGEVYLTTALQEYASSNDLYGLKIDGNWHDTGNKEKYLEAILDVALDDPDLSQVIHNFLGKNQK